MKKILNKSSFLLACLGLVFLFSPNSIRNSKSSDNRPDDDASLLTAFQGSCNTQGAFTASANAQTQSIVTIIETFEKRACIFHDYQVLNRANTLYTTDPAFAR